MALGDNDTACFFFFDNKSIIPKLKSPTLDTFTCYFNKDNKEVPLE